MKTIKTILIIIILAVFVPVSVCPVFAAEIPDTQGPPPTAPTLAATNVSNGIRLTWTQPKSADGYYIYRRISEDGKWQKYRTVTSSTTLRIVNTAVENGTNYFYKAIAYNDHGRSGYSNTVSSYRLKPPVLTQFQKSDTALTVEWSPNELASGYQLQYCRNSFFNGARAITINDPAVTSKTINNLLPGNKYYVRIRAFKTLNGSDQYSCWTLSNNAITNRSAKISRLSFNGEKFELRKAAKQKVGSYDTLQGGCCFIYGYFTLYNRNEEKCKIAKVNLKSGKVVKLSKTLNILHGNDLAYNPNKKQLVAAHSSTSPKKVSIINPDTLKVIKTKNIYLNKPLPGMSESRRASYSGIGAIAYNTKYNQYVARIRNLSDLLILDDNLNPVRYIRLTQKDSQLYQGLDTYDDYVLVGQSPKDGKPYNIISVYDWNGNYISKINVKKGYELENIFHKGASFYAGFYTSYYETYYLKGFKIKKVKGKKTKVKSLLKYTRLQRVNYIYKLSGI